MILESFLGLSLATQQPVTTESAPQPAMADMAPEIALAPPPPVLVPPPAPEYRPTPTSFAGNRIMVYNFLDIREKELTSKVLAKVEAQLIDYLAAHSGGAEIIRSTTAGAKVGAYYAGGLGTSVVPVDHMVAAEKQREIAYGNEFRLIVFPSDWLSSGAWRHYTIRFVVEDAVTGAKIMDESYSGEHLVMWKESENSGKRAEKIIRALSEKLAENGLAPAIIEKEERTSRR